MKTALLIGILALALAVIGPLLASRRRDRVSDSKYFAAARQRAIAYRLAAGQRAAKSAGQQ